MAVYLVNGANRGIGLGLCQALVNQGHEVIATCRKASSQLEQLGVRVIENIDLAKPASFGAIVDEMGENSIDVLINNAGIARKSSLEDLNSEGIIEQFKVNALGALQFATALLPAMKTPGKITFITSRMGSIADNDSGRGYGYRMSKAALNMAGKSLSIDLQTKNIAVGLIHPGWVQTDMTGEGALLTIEASSKMLLEIITKLNMGNTGSFWHANGEILPW